MEYLLLIYDDEKVWAKMPEAERNGVYAEYGAFTNALQSEIGRASCRERV